MYTHGIDNRYSHRQIVGMRKKREAVVMIRASKDEKAVWEAAADREGLPVAGWFRQIANREARRSAGDEMVLTGSGDMG